MALAGCGGGNRPVPVSGTVTIDGKPLTDGYIWVMPSDARAAGSKIDAQGRFQLTTHEEGDGCVKGTHKVTVTSTRQLNPSTVRHLIPPNYRDPTTSEKTVTIEGPTDNLVVELSWAGGQPYVEQTGGAGDVAPPPADETAPPTD